MGVLHDLKISFTRRFFIAEDQQSYYLTRENSRMQRTLNDILQISYEELGNNYNLDVSRIQNQRIRDLSLKRTERKIADYFSDWNDTLTAEEINHNLDLHYEKIDLLYDLRDEKENISKEKMERLVAIMLKTNDREGLNELEKIEAKYNILDSQNDERNSLNEHLEKALNNADVKFTLNVEDKNITVSGKFTPTSRSNKEHEIG